MTLSWSSRAIRCRSWSSSSRWWATSSRSSAWRSSRVRSARSRAWAAVSSYRRWARRRSASPAWARLGGMQRDGGLVGEDPQHRQVARLRLVLEAVQPDQAADRLPGQGHRHPDRGVVAGSARGVARPDGAELASYTWGEIGLVVDERAAGAVHDEEAGPGAGELAVGQAEDQPRRVEVLGGGARDLLQQPARALERADQAARDRVHRPDRPLHALVGAHVGAVVGPLAGADPGEGRQVELLGHGALPVTALRGRASPRRGAWPHAGWSSGRRRRAWCPRAGVRRPR